MKKLSNSAMRFFIIAFVFFLAAISSFVFSLKLLSDMGKEYADSLQLIANIDEQTRELSRIDSIIASSAEDRSRLEGYFLDVVQVAQFLETIEQYAIRNNLSLDSASISEISPSNESTDPARVRIPYEVTGDRTAVLQFITLLETLPYHSELQRLRIRQSSGSSLVSAEVDVIISYQ